MVWIEMVCDCCNDTCGGRSYKNGAIANLRIEAKKLGWKTIKGKTYCPLCQERMHGGSDGNN